jgi:hypothetical protein
MFLESEGLPSVPAAAGTPNLFYIHWESLITEYVMFCSAAISLLMDSMKFPYRPGALFPNPQLLIPNPQT